MSGKFRLSAKEKATIILLITGMLIATVHIAGCGRAPGERRNFVFKKNGRVIGTEEVTIRRGRDSVVYIGRAKRPYSAQDTGIYRSARLTGKSLLLGAYFSYAEKARVRKRVRFLRVGSSFKYFKNDILTFSFIETDKVPKEILPFDAESAVMIQLLIDAWRSRGMPRKMSVVLPYRSLIFREVLISKAGNSSYEVKLPGLMEARVDIDEDEHLIKTINLLKKDCSIEEGSSILPKKTLLPRFGSLTTVKIPTTGGIELSGLLCRPNKSPPYPVVLMACDTGCYDRSGGGIFVDLAEELVRKGFAVLCVDRRGAGESEGKPEYSLDTAVSDLCSQVDFLLLRGDIDPERIFALGYGEGGYVAAKAAVKNPYISGIIMLGTPADRVFPDAFVRRIGLLREKELLDGYDESFWKSEISWLESIPKQIQVDYVSADGELAFLGWVRSFSVPVVEDVAGVIEVPVLLIYGSSDKIASPEHGRAIFERLKPSIRRISSLKVINGLDHQFGRIEPEEGAQPFPSRVVASSKIKGAITEWLSALTGKRSE